MTDNAHDSRHRVQVVIDSAPEPLTVEVIAERTGLHANTVRGHLDVLLATGSITRQAADSHGRGRPRWLYASAAPASSPFRALAEALTSQLAAVRDPDMAQAAADRWLQALPELPKASTPDEAVAEATQALNRLGFNAVTTPLGDAIAVTACPYADLVDDNPVICDIHTALVARLLTSTGQPVTVRSMDVWARPGMCMAWLRRDDLRPSWTVETDERGVVMTTKEAVR